ncbi:uncharacterized protein ARMOST_20171 [Armillaria ostoyae]|uniref:Uncharacterized protein n=1 Tax=Armillaria ostoyae TaxID=47428 RepID=A0A284S6M2_ARMOS|nr:uncharacterized protein ARMOST_20171 [Armillaria ostoyae]
MCSYLTFSHALPDPLFSPFVSSLVHVMPTATTPLLSEYLHRRHIDFEKLKMLEQSHDCLHPTSAAANTAVPVDTAAATSDGNTAHLQK